MTYIEMDAREIRVYTYRDSLICRIKQDLLPTDVVILARHRMSYRVKFVGSNHTFYNIDAIEWKGEPGMSPFIERE